MNKTVSGIIISLLFCIDVAKCKDIDSYNVVWDTQSSNSSESMPCGGGDIGLNVWVENGDVLFYVSRSGTFDENNTLLKLGRVRLKMTPNLLNESFFEQKLNLKDGYVSIKGANKDHKVNLRIWVDVFNPVINIDVESDIEISIEALYESWRYKDRLLRKNESNQNSYKWASPQGLMTQKDSVSFDNDAVLFFHKNVNPTVFDATVKQQGLEDYKSEIYNPLRNLIFGGLLEGKDFMKKEESYGIYSTTDYKAWSIITKEKTKKTNLQLRLYTQQTNEIREWEKNLKSVSSCSFEETVSWWNAFWKRSWIYIDSKNKKSQWFEIGQNYQLFRYMLGCNAYGTYPTKFNGGLFTYDPIYTDTIYGFTPDFRKWGGGTHTAQNQRLVYFPMLKSGDFDMMTSQFDFYNRLLPVAELRSRIYWGHNGASYTEQIENFGLPNPSEYGWKRPENYDKGLEYNAWLEYQWDTALEFCLMILEKETYTGEEISDYVPMIESILTFFDEHYQYLSSKRGRKSLTEEGKLVLYPGSACETYKMAYNAVSTISALKVVAERLIQSFTAKKDTSRINHWLEFISRIPEIKTREFNGNTTIAPAQLWERINNIETPQLYPVFPWGIFGVGKSNLEIARNTWYYDPDVIKFRSHIGWKQDAIWAARLGLVDEANRLIEKKLHKSETRFPVFWGPGFDWSPDHNWGGSGMIALQEMLMQVDEEKIYLFPAWDVAKDVEFKLHAPYNTTIECKLENGEISHLYVYPKHREGDIDVMIKK
ncbi:MAG: hypothetical protein GX963_02390 [Bacteroidales bacterium]|nr:hypothetical protein [Bacteroidales bacterium]